MGIKKFTFANVESVEKRLFQWVSPRRYRLVFLLFVISMVVAADFVPYVNLFLNSYVVVLISVLLVPFVLDLDSKIFFALGTSCFFLVVILWFIGQTEEAETLTEYIFIILLSGSVKVFLSGE